MDSVNKRNGILPIGYFPVSMNLRILPPCSSMRNRTRSASVGFIILMQSSSHCLGRTSYASRPMKIYFDSSCIYCSWTTYNANNQTMLTVISLQLNLNSSVNIYLLNFDILQLAWAWIHCLLAAPWEAFKVSQEALLWDSSYSYSHLRTVCVEILVLIAQWF